MIMETQLSLINLSEQPARATQSSAKKANSSSAPQHLAIYIDGAARGNPGPAGAGICMILDDQKIVEKGFYLKEKTNNQAEYLALVLALLLLEKVFEKHDLADTHCTFFSDSELLVKQMRGEYKIKNAALAALKKLADELARTYTHRFTHVTRDKNKIADKLANLGIDKKNRIPVTLTKILDHWGLSI